MWRGFIDGLVKGFSSMVEDVRRRVVETGWFGSPVTGRTNTITIDSLAEKSPSERLGWDWPRPKGGPNQGHDRERAAQDRHGPERGIDR